MALSVYDSMTRRRELFTPHDPSDVTMYVCGPTVYDTPHLGNARPAVVFDVLFRLLRSGYGARNVRYARNITDIDDKIIDRAARNGESIVDLTTRTTAEYHAVVDLLGCLRPTHEPRATQSIDAMRAQIGILIDSGVAYESEGHVLFAVKLYTRHGALSRHKQADLQSGQHRVEAASYKRDPEDFVLWKPSTTDQPGWPSPWGWGRPGWHIECSAMIEQLFDGKTIDIHGGGGDLRFPHHDCEISQYACSGEHHGRVLARTWMHNGMVLTEGEKMAKSAGNFFTVRDIIASGYSGAEIRFALLQTHYRQPLEWSENGLALARTALAGWRDALLRFKKVRPYDVYPSAVLGFYDAMNDDLNTPAAIACLHEQAKLANAGSSLAAAYLRNGINLLGLGDHFDRMLDETLEPEAQVIFLQREHAREARDYALSDRLRDELRALGVHVKDTKLETLWWRS